MNPVKIPEEFYVYFEKAGRQVNYEPGETIYMQGESAETLYFIKEGRVRAFYVTRGGKELTLEVVEKGKIIGESSFLSQSAYPVSVEAVTPVKILACDLEHLYQYMEESKGLMRIMLSLLSRTCNHLVEQLRRVTLYDRYQRVASFLLYETEYPDSDRGVTPTSIPYTQEELAVTLGLNRVTVSRVLGEWKEQGIIQTSYKHIRILDRKSLVKLIKPFGE